MDTPGGLDLMSSRCVASYLGVSVSFLEKRRVTGGGPPYMKLGRRVLYNRGDLEAWAKRLMREHTSQLPSS